MQHFLKRPLLALGGALALSTLAMVPAVHAETVKVTFVGVGDIYDFEGAGDRGGFARLNAVAKAEKANNPNTLYVFDGDMISPSLLSGLDKGANTIDLTNVVPFDLAVPGNHEFDFGPDVFMQRVKQSKFPWAAINIQGPDGNPVEGVGHDTVMKEVGGLKIALVPVALDETTVLATTKDWQFTPSVATALDAAQKARSDGADLVVAVTHTDHAGDDALTSSHLFDVVISGHDHDVRTTYDGVSAYVETSTEADYLPVLDLNVNVEEKDGKRSLSWTPDFRFIDTALVERDPDTQAVVEKLKTNLSAELDVEIGKTSVPLDSRRNIVRLQESAIGDIIADAMKGANGADIAITNGGGIRGDKEYPAGTTLTRRDVFTELPFGNVTVVTQLSGQAVLDGLENGFSKIETGEGRFPQVSSLKVTVDRTKAAGARVVSVEVNGAPLDPAKTYTLATNDYMLGVGDGYTSFGTGKVVINASAGNLMASDVMNYIQAAKTIDTTVGDRIVFVK